MKSCGEGVCIASAYVVVYKSGQSKRDFDLMYIFSLYIVLIDWTAL